MITDNLLTLSWFRAKLNRPSEYISHTQPQTFVCCACAQELNFYQPIQKGVHNKPSGLKKNVTA